MDASARFDGNRGYFGGVWARRGSFTPHFVCSWCFCVRLVGPFRALNVLSICRLHRGSTHAHFHAILGMFRGRSIGDPLARPVTMYVAPHSAVTNWAGGVGCCGGRVMLWEPTGAGMAPREDGYDRVGPPNGRFGRNLLWKVWKILGKCHILA
jgi:hypothetical protein